ncbi:hypothetical protein AVEN_49243-1 [Araneus ventricosus]|uniref:Uncharacterized protein n=1 Tax=Araneus ventricosus TaxID=182803 RepID=A0A4Y2LYC9_ARAVE|nr:hypothetical protein AVEN_49243-1 [Araneus ventricosus]
MLNKKLEILQKLYNGESVSIDAEDVLNEGNTISHSAALQSVESLLDYMGQRGFDYGDITARGTISTDVMAGATNRNTMPNECCNAARLVQERSALILVDDLRNVAYLQLFKLCPLAGVLYMARNIFSPACDIASGVDDRL